MNYDEELELIDYVWRYFSHLMTDFEQQVNHASIGRRKVAACDHPTMSRMLNDRWARPDDRAINSALAAGEEQFRSRVAHRVLAEQKDQAFVNRCPNCGRLVRTPWAKQCFWCGQDWHAKQG